MTPTIHPSNPTRSITLYPASGSVYQPVYLGRRDDIPADECTVDQLKFKGAGAGAEAARG